MYRPTAAQLDALAFVAVTGHLPPGIHGATMRFVMTYVVAKHPAYRGTRQWEISPKGDQWRIYYRRTATYRAHEALNAAGFRLRLNVRLPKSRMLRYEKSIQQGYEAVALVDRGEITFHLEHSFRMVECVPVGVKLRDFERAVWQ